MKRTVLVPIVWGVLMAGGAGSAFADITSVIPFGRVWSVQQSPPRGRGQGNNAEGPGGAMQPAPGRSPQQEVRPHGDLRSDIYNHIREQRGGPPPSEPPPRERRGDRGR
ncbi:hypothetical protein PTE30175_04990 [Pandoraea terrae]|uniref:Peptide-binding protein n=1 Tax=Pandoraea terrae TaxID=1537710 RepID=A0A5E4Z5M6_9BURK|nr:hypothetical protein [Pandoraea terrae]VVE56416.1 hypothetical protein PTE30175_04990 [Pandoraea terrae]